jgi:hypothetical protein
VDDAETRSQQEFVIGGYRPGNHGVDALFVGVYSSKDLVFAGKVRASFTPTCAARGLRRTTIR